MRYSGIITALFFALTTTALAQRPMEKESIVMHSDAMNRDVKYSVIVPQTANSQAKYPVLYLLHGIGGDNTSWLEYTDIAGMMERGEMLQMVVVSPDGYLSYYADAADGSLPYETFFRNELMPMIQAAYPVSTRREDHYIGGFSMGGFGALTLGLRNRDRFGHILALSPSMRTDSVYAHEGPQKEWDKQWGHTFGGVGKVGYDRITRYYRDRAPMHIVDTLDVEQLRSLDITIDIGDRENSLAEPSEIMHRRLNERGVNHKYVVREGGHDFLCWNSAFTDYMKALADDRKPVDVSAPGKSSAINVDNSIVYMPAAHVNSDRKYPVVYVRGKFTDSQREAISEATEQEILAGSIRPLILCFLDEADSIEAIESAVPSIRGERRFRALIDVNASPDFLATHLNGDDPMFTAVVMYNPLQGATSPIHFVGLMKKHRRYPRLWIAQNPDSYTYNWASQLHPLMREDKLEHRYLVNKETSSTYLPQLSEWLSFIDNRIHI